MSQGIAPARLAAFEILLKMESGAGHCDELLRTMRVQSLSPQDRNLCTNLVMGTLRWQIALDAQVTRLLSRPDVKLADGIRVALRLGAFQLLHLDRIPAHAAISESVEIAKFGGEGFAAGMVNAVLRKLAVAGPPKIPARFRNAAELAAAYAHPAWMVERWVQFYGMERTRQICRFDQEPPPTTVRLAVDPDTAEARVIEDELKAAGVELAPGAFLTRARTVVRGDVTVTEAYRQGRVRIQDEGSQLVAELTRRGERILDCCAAPGGKTAILAERNPESSVLACDVSGRRLDQMKKLFSGREVPGIPGKVSYQVADAADLSAEARFEGAFDLVLCDVPCSGTGTLARNPEIRHRLNVEALARQRKRQVEILRGAMRTVAAGGRVIYATCSLEPEENDAVVAACLAEVRGFRRVGFDIAPLVGGVGNECGAIRAEATEALRETAFEAGCLRTLPGVHPCDGFFAALLVKD
ncbi:MAG TPA: 16S rRNA (cytosine(967)-C(5))-methyltransferase RsmB [Acidisarcina sp.]